MTRIFQNLAIASALILIATGCEPPDTDGDQGQAQQPAEAVSEDGPSSIDDGGIDAVPDDPALVEKGEGLYRTEGCIGCHQMDHASAGPALGGVTERRSAAWLARMIMHPDKMTDQDPEAQKIASEFAAPMPATNLTPEQAEALIAYLGAQ